MTAFLKDPQNNRPNECIGGGFIVFRRGRRTNRIRPNHWPFEHPTREQAEAEARRLAELHPGRVFCVFRQDAAIYVEGATDEPA